MFCEPCADHVRSLAALRASDLSGESIPQKGKQA
jgi:hypothetical protein